MTSPENGSTPLQRYERLFDTAIYFDELPAYPAGRGRGILRSLDVEPPLPPNLDTQQVQVISEEDKKWLAEMTLTPQADESGEQQ